MQRETPSLKNSHAKLTFIIDKLTICLQATQALDISPTSHTAENNSILQ
jgi:hypothetical protein